jgi:aminopeptidase N
LICLQIASVSASGPEGLQLAWDYLRENFTKAHAIVATASPSLLAALVTVSTQGFATAERATEIEEFFQSKDVPLISRKIDQICETIRSNAAFLDMIKQSTKIDGVLPKV